MRFKRQLLSSCALLATLSCFGARAYAQTGGAPAPAAPPASPPASTAPSDQAPAPASAQTPASGAAVGGGTQLGVVVVTATRRATNLQTTPIAVSAVTSQLIAQTSPRDIGDLAKFVPDFTAAKITGFNAASFAMRGEGQNNIIVYYESPVAVLVDDFVMPSVQTQLLDTFDVSQVEVLRGPQGTLFGKNTTAGAVSVQTKRPDLDAASLEAQAEFGDFGTAQAKLAADLPLIQDKLSLRVVGGYEYSDGYMKNGAPFGPVVSFAPSPYAGVQGQGNGEAVGGEKVFNGRVKLLWKPNDRITSLLQYEIVRDLSPTPAEVNTTPNSPVTASNPNGYYFANLGLSGPTSGNPLNQAGLTNRNDTLIDENSGGRVFVDGGYWNTDIRLDPGTITIDSGYRNQRSRLSNTYPGVAPVDSAGQPLSLFDANRSDNRQTFQQEVRFSSHLDGPLNFVSGLFYQYDQVNFCVGQLLGFEDLLAGPTPYGPWNDNPYVLCNNQHENSYAGYIEGNYKVTSKLTLTAGFRYTEDDKIWQGRQQVFAQQLGASSYQQIGNLLNFGNFSQYPQGVVSDKVNEGAPTYRGSAGYQFTPTVYGYFTYSHGFKSGDFNDQIGSFAPFGTNLDAFKEAATATKPEFANSYEGGMKTEFFDHRLRMNVTGFYVRYADLQKQIVVPITVNGEPFEVTRFFNAAKAEVKGVEGEFAAIPIHNLTLRAVVGYQDGDYISYTTPTPPGHDLAADPLDRTPKWTWTLSGNYVFTVFDRAHITIDSDVEYTDKQLYTESIGPADQNTYLNAHTLVNASLQLSDLEDRKYIRIIGQNLGDRIYTTATQIVGGLWSDAMYGPPRYIGVQMGVKFGG